jgi:GAF domain-containing protein
MPDDSRVNVDAAAKDALVGAINQLDATSAALRLLDDPANPMGSAVLYEANRSFGGTSYECLDHPQPPTHNMLDVLQRGEELSGDTSTDWQAPRDLKALGMRAYLAVPLRLPTGGAPIGALFLNRNRPYPFTVPDRVVARQLASQVVAALTQATQPA